MDVIKFGPSGADENFYLKYKSTEQMPEYLTELQLDCFEYSFGRGVRMSKSSATAIKNAFQSGGYEISAHAPYFINFANPEAEKVQNTFAYLRETMDALLLLGGKRAVFHPGSPLKQERSLAFEALKTNFRIFCEEVLSQELYKDLFVCPETMGKLNQMGTVEEVAELCAFHPQVVPCVDFGHVNARTQGGLKKVADFQKVIDVLADHMEWWKVKNMHVHFSKIEYGDKGEIRHLTFEDNVYGPQFEPLAEVLVKNDLTPYIVSESAGTQGNDAQIMKNLFKIAKNSLA